MKDDVFCLGIKAIFRNVNGEILLLKINKKTYAKKVPNHWDLPGGKIFKGEEIEEALKREVEEEIGIKNIKIIKFIDASISKIRISHTDAGLILFTYLCEIENIKDVKLIDNEHTEFKWYTPKEASKLLKTKFADSLIEIIKKL